MPYLVITSWFPMIKGGEVAEKYIEGRKQFPPDRSLAKEVIQGVIKVKKDKAMSITISEVKEGKLDEAFKRQQESMIPYHDIQGFEYSIEVFLSFAEAMSMIGMKAPE
ncbi:MAG: hypothetical protein ACFFDN_37240 [Candidatus Hodarchaeota archaeon]